MQVLLRIVVGSSLTSLTVRKKSVIRMVSMQMLVPLAVLLISHGASAYTSPECSHTSKAKLRSSLRSAHQQNEELKTILQEDQSMQDIKEDVSLANQKITSALSTTEKEQLLNVLKQALHSENAALYKAKLRCKPNSDCWRALRSLFSTVFKLVEAVIEAAEGGRKEAVQKVYETFKGGSGSDTERAYEMGTKVLAFIVRKVTSVRCASLICITNQ